MKQKFQSAKHLTIATDKTSSMVFKKFPKSICVRTGKNKNAFVTVDVLSSAEVSQPLTFFDRTVLDVVVTLYEAGNQTITLAQIYRHIIGQPASKRQAPKHMAELISQSMEGLGCRMVRIDASEEAKVYEMKIENAVLTGNLLSFTSLSVSFKGGKQITAYHINATPLLYEYAKSKKQVDSVLPVAVGNAPVRHTKQNIELVSYLEHRILAMRPTKKHQHKAISKNINVANMLDELGIAPKEGKPTNSSKKAKSRAMQTIIKILDYWKTIICTDGKPLIGSYLVHGRKPIKSIEIRF